jgi:hypothetical protein
MWISDFGMHKRPDVRLLRKIKYPPNPGIEAPMFIVYFNVSEFRFNENVYNS